MSVHRVLPEPAGPVSWAEAYPWPEGAFVRANFVVSVDGAAAVTGRVGALSRPLDHELFRWLRATADAVVVGASTVRAERYGPVRVDDDVRAEREANGQAPVPPIVIVTRSARLDWRMPVFTTHDGARPIIVTTKSASDAALDGATDVAEVLVLGDDDVDLGRVLDELRARGMTRVLTEGGPTLLAELWKDRLVDELCLTVAPVLVGGDEPRLMSPVFDGLDALELVHVLEGDGDLFVRYARRHGSER